MKQKIIVDTGFWVALFNKDDNYHADVEEFFTKIDAPLITTMPVITEVCYFLQECDSQKKSQKVVTFLSALKDMKITLFTISDVHLNRLTELISKYSDVPMDFADASLVLLAENLKQDKILTIDSDFNIYRWKCNNSYYPFSNLLYFFNNKTH